MATRQMGSVESFLSSSKLMQGSTSSADTSTWLLFYHTTQHHFAQATSCGSRQQYKLKLFQFPISQFHIFQFTVLQLTLRFYLPHL